MAGEADFAFSKLFTAAEANAALPLVRAIAADLVRLSREVIERREHLGVLMKRRSSGFFRHYREELTQIDEELQRSTRQLQEYVEELRRLGVEPKSAPEGLIDFPAMIDGRLVYLCWKLGEPRVSFWHELTAGYQGRQPLKPDALAEPRPVASKDTPG